MRSKDLMNFFPQYRLKRFATRCFPVFIIPSVENRRIPDILEMPKGCGIEMRLPTSTDLKSLRQPFNCPESVKVLLMEESG
jgi:hypothetical protein